MKIGIVCWSSCGGSGVLATELGYALAQSGYEIHFISAEMPFRYKELAAPNIFFHCVEKKNYPLFTNDAVYSLLLASKIVEIKKKYALDLLHVHYAMPHAISAFLAQEMLGDTQLPLVTTLHGTDVILSEKWPAMFDVVKFSIEKSTVVTAVSNYLTKKNYNIFGDTIKVETIYNFVDYHKFNPKEESQEVSTVTYIHISNFRAIKRSVDVIECFYLIQKEVPNAMALMVGEGPLLADCQTKVEAYNLQNKVRFIGSDKNITPLLNESDIMILPSEVESFSLVAIEAGASEIPVLAYKVGGLVEVVSDRHSGFLFEKGDYQAMARKGIELAKNPVLRKQIGRQARSFVKSKFSPEKIIPQYENIYKKALASKGSKAIS